MAQQHHHEGVVVLSLICRLLAALALYPVVHISLCVACSALAWYAAACAGMLRSCLMVSDLCANGASFDAPFNVTTEKLK